MEGLAFIEVVSVGGPNNVRVLILFGPPRAAIPQLTVAFVAAGQRVRPARKLKFGQVFKGGGRISVSEGGSVVDGRTLETSPRRRHVVIFRLKLLCRVHHRPQTVSATRRVQRPILTRDERRVEASRCKGRGLLVEHFGLQHVTSLLAGSLSKEYVADLDTRHVALVAGNHGGSAGRRTLKNQK